MTKHSEKALVDDPTHKHHGLARKELLEAEIKEYGRLCINTFIVWSLFAVTALLIYFGSGTGDSSVAIVSLLFLYLVLGIGGLIAIGLGVVFVFCFLFRLAQV